jgi:Histidinol dehydrogenase.
MKRKAIIKAAVEQHSAIILVKDVDEAAMWQTCWRQST